MAEKNVVIRDVNPADSTEIAEIYNHYILNSIITFEEDVVSPQVMAERFEEVLQSSLPWLIAELDGTVAGYCYATKWKGRCAYRYSVEITVYLHPEKTGLGLGHKLYSALMERLRGLGIRTVIGGIALPNDASIALHEKIGMQKVAHFREVGFKFGRWIDVGYWQMNLK